ncbi:hypothetical protein [Mesorhizobium sp. M1A.F.Ca.ET.072.01.1.1]|uniref:hypothetical protein n=1 Tax=Mesorhizobium sp. M1A.F.Ca.ET.072.01.1.1 TaxID=2496753 RepID=UPI001FE12603|nr:hypothetical protein [Mesorhizobium sp. M1A.F.Ca.ET.072.01.1.1]
MPRRISSSAGVAQVVHHLVQHFDDIAGDGQQPLAGGSHGNTAAMPFEYALPDDTLQFLHLEADGCISTVLRHYLWFEVCATSASRQVRQWRSSLQAAR